MAWSSWPGASSPRVEAGTLPPPARLLSWPGCVGYGGCPFAGVNAHVSNPELENESYNLSDMVYEKLISAVISGKFAVNSKLPPEIELARQIDVSRPILRIALQRLRDDGILKSRRGSGNFIIRQPHQTVLQMVQLSQIPDIQNCFKFRIGVEGESAFYAAINRDNAFLEKINRALSGLDDAALNNISGVDADFDFHMNIAQASGNPYFVSSLAAIRDQFIFGISVTHNLSLRRTKKRLSLVGAEHQAIGEAIARSDPEQARLAMRQHLEHARRRLFEGDLVESYSEERPGS
jgi:DNA-binding FadR family transcriptional regulator